MIKAAKNPNRLNFGVCYQYDLDDDHDEDFKTNSELSSIIDEYK